jgi:hypothetical protein
MTSITARRPSAVQLIVLGLSAVAVGLVLLVLRPAPVLAEEVACVPGTFSATGNAPCTDAPAGAFVAVEGATEASLCAAGTDRKSVV